MRSLSASPKPKRKPILTAMSRRSPPCCKNLPKRMKTTTEPLIFENSRAGRRAANLPECDVPYTDPAALLGEGNLRADLPLPEVSELDVVRHFTHLSHRNYSIDWGFYPLGSCTMKYNP